MNPNLADTLVAGRGGFLRRITMINAERAADAHRPVVRRHDLRPVHEADVALTGAVGLLDLPDLQRPRSGSARIEFPVRAYGHLRHLPAV